jgi:hypothetical protein
MRPGRRERAERRKQQALATLEARLKDVRAAKVEKPSAPEPKSTITKQVQALPTAELIKLITTVAADAAAKAAILFMTTMGNAILERPIQVRYNTVPPPNNPVLVAVKHKRLLPVNRDCEFLYSDISHKVSAGLIRDTKIGTRFERELKEAGIISCNLHISHCVINEFDITYFTCCNSVNNAVHMNVFRRFSQVFSQVFWRVFTGFFYVFTEHVALQVYENL